MSSDDERQAERENVLVPVRHVRHTWGPSSSTAYGREKEENDASRRTLRYRGGRGPADQSVWFWTVVALSVASTGRKSLSAWAVRPYEVRDAHLVSIKS